MQSEEQRLIDGLFSRLKEAETHSASRDASAEERIAQHVTQQPAAPYYMAQTILIQEAAIKQLNDRIQALEAQVSQLQAAKPSSGGFLSGLFGGGQSAAPIRFQEPSNMAARRRITLNRSMRHSKTMPRRRQAAAAAALWRAHYKPRPGWQAAWCWAIC